MSAPARDSSEFSRPPTKHEADLARAAAAGFTNVLQPDTPEAFEVQRLTKKIEAQLAFGEQILESNSTLPYATKKAVPWLIGCAAVLALSYLLFHQPFSGAVSLYLLFKAIRLQRSDDPSKLTVWAITNQNVIAITKNATQKYPLEQIRLRNPRVIGTDIAFFIGPIKSVRMSRLREPEKMLRALISAVATQNSPSQKPS